VVVFPSSVCVVVPSLWLRGSDMCMWPDDESNLDAQVADAGHVVGTAGKWLCRVLLRDSKASIGVWFYVLYCELFISLLPPLSWFVHIHFTFVAHLHPILQIPECSMLQPSTYKR